MKQCCKAGTAIEKYDISPGPVLGDTDEYLISRWKGEGDHESVGIRPLRDWLNKEIIMTVYDEHDRTAIESTVESDYNVLLEGDDIQQSELIGDLATDGIDGDELMQDLVSQSTMYRHLTKCLEEEKKAQEPEESSVQSAINRIQYAVGSPESSIKKGLRTLENEGAIPSATDSEMSLQLKLACPECATQKSLERAIEDGAICEKHMGKVETTVEELESDNTATQKGA